MDFHEAIVLEAALECVLEFGMAVYEIVSVFGPEVLHEGMLGESDVGVAELEEKLVVLEMSFFVAK